jgi:glycosyltransferase involved in cell wall biosynthesis
MPLISVIIPCFNGADTIEKALRSIVAQDFDAVEVIVVDDASTDTTQQVLSRFDEIPIQVIRQPVNMGVSHARNIGMRSAKGTWIQFLDADDYLLPGKFSVQLSRRADADLIYSDWGSEYQLPTPRLVLEPKRFFIDLPPLPQLLGSNPFPVHLPLVRREFIQKLDGPFNPDRMHEDWDFWFRIFEFNPRVAYVQHLSCIYRRFDETRNSNQRRCFQGDIDFLEHLNKASLTSESVAQLDREIRKRKIALAANQLLADDVFEAEKILSMLAPLSVSEAIDVVIARKPALRFLFNRVFGPRRLIRWLKEARTRWRHD